MNRFSITLTTLALAATMLLTACSKDGAGQRLLDGPSQVNEPQPTDGNMPGPNE